MERTELDFWGNHGVLVPGCGAGHDVRMLAAAVGNVLGLDISPAAVEQVSRHPRVSDERYCVGDFLAPGWSKGVVFSAMWEHTCFCAIDPALRGRYAESAAEVIEPGGVLAGVFYLTPEKAPGEESQPPFGATIEEIESHFSPWFQLMDGRVPSVCYPGREGREWLAVFRRLSDERVA